MMRVSTAFTLLASLSAAAAFRLPVPAQDALELLEASLPQLPWTGHAASVPAADLLTPASDVKISSIRTDEYTVLTSPLHPNHKVRIKSTDGWCDPTARSWSGYIDVGHGRELFFYFFESRDKPAEDPVVMWINGGPGCSSEMGLFMELGPCTVNDSPKGINDTTANPHSWNNHANVFFLDEPINVGFSRGKHGQEVGTTEEAAKDVAAFVTIFFETFKEFEGRAFHMSGESYGGRYLPLFAAAVYDNNAKLVKAERTPINLQSVLIGNGITDSYATTESYFPYLCNRHPDLNRSVLPIDACVSLAETVPKCRKMAKEMCIDTKDYTQCSIASSYCSETLGSSFLWAGVNPYDVSQPCTLEELGSTLCYPETVKIGDYLNLPEVRGFLGINDKKVGKWEGCNGRVNQLFHQNQDPQSQTWLYVAQLLERGIRVLNYVGTLDYICNYIGNEEWMEALQWTGKAAYNAAERRDWHVDSEVAGYTKTSGDLTFLTIYGAGHMVPMDQPKRAEVMLDAWLNGEQMPK